MPCFSKVWNVLSVTSFSKNARHKEFYVITELSCTHLWRCPFCELKCSVRTFRSAVTQSSCSIRYDDYILISTSYHTEDYQSYSSEVSPHISAGITYFVPLNENADITVRAILGIQCSSTTPVFLSLVHAQPILNPVGYWQNSVQACTLSLPQR